MQNTFGQDQLGGTYEALLWHLRQWNVRLRLVRTVTWLPRGILVGVLIALTIGVSAWLRPWLLQETLVRISIVSVAGCALLTFIAVWLWPRPVSRSAQDFDLRFDLRERMTTALELTTGTLKAPDYMIARQLEDMRLAANRVLPTTLLPIKIRWAELIVVLFALVGLILSLVLDNPQTTKVEARQALDNEIQQQIDDLEELEADIANNAELMDAERQDLQEPIQDALDTLNEDDISREEAVAALAEAEDDLRELSEGLSAEERQANEQAGNDLSSNSLTDELGRELGDNNLDQAANESQELGNDLEGLTEEQRNDVADQLDQAAETLQESNPELAQQLNEAAEALREGDTEAAQQALDEAAETLNQQSSENANSAQAQTAEELANQVAQSRQEVTNQGQQPQAGSQQPNGQPQQQSGEGQQSAQQGEGQPSDQGSPGQQPQDGQSSDGSSSSESGAGQGQEPSDQSQPGSQQSQAGESGEPGGSGAGDSGSENTGDSSTTSGPNSATADNSPGNEDEREFENVFAPERIGGEGDTELILDSDVPTNEGEPLQDTNFNEDFQGESTVPYDQVFGDYEQAARDALDSEYIPIGVRDVIRSYFSSLEP